MPQIAPGVIEYGNPGTPATAVITVTRRQALRALDAAGLTAAVENAINALPEPQRSRARIDWDNAAEFRRDFPLLAQLAASMGLAAAQVDALFAAAAAVE